MSKIIFLFCLVSFLSSCKKDPDMSLQLIPDQVRAEVETFISEGKQRGVNVELKGLEIVLSSNLMNGWGGYYDHSNHKIFLDTTDFVFKDKETKQRLIFHELAHGILNRQHINNLLPNGDAASIMNINIRADWSGLNIFKRQYYIDELFNENTHLPFWGS